MMIRGDISHYPDEKNKWINRQQYSGCLKYSTYIQYNQINDTDRTASR